MSTTTTTPETHTIIAPPIENAQLRVCANGENKGLRYWVYRDRFGNQQFYGWLDKPANSNNFEKLLEKVTEIHAFLLKGSLNADLEDERPTKRTKKNSD
jgi:hypothetical protein